MGTKRPNLQDLFGCIGTFLTVRDRPRNLFVDRSGLSCLLGQDKPRLPPAGPKAQPAGAGIWSCPKKQGSPNRSKNESLELSPTVTKVPIQPILSRVRELSQHVRESIQVLLDPGREIPDLRPESGPREAPKGRDFLAIDGEVWPRHRHRQVRCEKWCKNVSENNFILKGFREHCPTPDFMPKPGK